MSRFRLYIALISAVVLMGCVRETLYDMPSVDLIVSWENSRDKSHSDAMFHFYPQFDYLTEPIEIPVVASASTNLALLPGKYKVLMYNTPLAPIVVDGKDAHDQMTARIDYTNNVAPTVSQFMALDANDPAKEIVVELDGRNKFEFKPISVSKKIRFVINGDEKFGQVDIVNAYLKGVVSKINLSTLKIETVENVLIENWKVEGRKFSSESIEVLGFDVQNKVTLLLVVQSPESDYPKEQPVDLTKEISEMVGDEIQITMDVEYKPDIRVRKITVTEWLAGNEINIDFN